mmetsp:Transcript_139624/g.246554  ORF Transcript_139624/g.246554 Transcript_139624/m.246554 type:complete len:129 (-) Transcript_139624:934-1320(-)
MEELHMTNSSPVHAAQPKQFNGCKMPRQGLSCNQELKQARNSHVKQRAVVKKPCDRRKKILSTGRPKLMKCNQGLKNSRNNHVKQSDSVSSGGHKPMNCNPGLRHYSNNCKKQKRMLEIGSVLAIAQT